MVYRVSVECAAPERRCPALVVLEHHKEIHLMDIYRGGLPRGCSRVSPVLARLGLLVANLAKWANPLTGSPGALQASFSPFFPLFPPRTGSWANWTVASLSRGGVG